MDAECIRKTFENGFAFRNRHVQYRFEASCLNSFYKSKEWLKNKSLWKIYTFTYSAGCVIFFYLQMQRRFQWSSMAHKNHKAKPSVCIFTSFAFSPANFLPCIFFEAHSSWVYVWVVVGGGVRARVCVCVCAQECWPTWNTAKKYCGMEICCDTPFVTSRIEPHPRNTCPEPITTSIS